MIKTLTAIACSFFLVTLCFPEEGTIHDLMEMSLEELMNVEIITASNEYEKLSEAPSTTIVISKNDITERGYGSFSEILDDLPGMDVIRSYGDTGFSNYWRGYRYNIGSPYLIMVDGMIFNHLYYNYAIIMETFSLKNIERIEVVYGPASSIYGPNAFMGVINVITQQDRNQEGSTIQAGFTQGAFNSSKADVSFFYKKGDFRISLTGRMDNGEIDKGSTENYEYTHPDYLTDRSLWGGIVDNPSISGPASSHRNRSMDLRVIAGSLEIGYQHFLLDTGYGMVYPTDKAQRNASWQVDETSIFMRYSKKLNENIQSRTLIRHRESSVPNESFFVEGYQSDSGRVVDFSYWQSINTSWSAFQDFNITLNDRLSIVAGLKYEEKDLQKSYDINYGESLDPTDISVYPYPDPPQDVKMRENRIITEDTGIYLQSKILFSEASLHLGIRHDSNSVYGNTTIFRGSLMRKFGKFIAKAMVGEAYQEPVPRLLYGGWQGSGSDPDLKPEKSTTYEFSLGYTREYLSHLLSVYYVKSSDTILNINEGAVNLGQRNVFGIDYHLKAIIHMNSIRQLKLWGYYSYTHTRGDEIYNINTDSFEKGEIGDISAHKIHFGATAVLSNHWSATLMGRYIGKRDTVITNPVGKVDGYLTGDLNIIMKDYLAEGWGLSFRITNILNKEYFHPGLREADAGTTPGFRDENGTWNGSNGWYNSLLPQPGRTWSLTLSLRF